MSRKKVARELPQKRRKRPTLLKKSNHASRAARTSQRSQPNNVLDNTRKSKTRVENPNFWVYSNPIRTQETVPKLVSDSTFVPKTPKPRTWRNPTLSFWYPNLIRIFLYPTRSLYRQRSRCWSCCWPPCPSSSSRSPRSLAALAHFPPHHAKELQVNEL